MPHDWVLLAVIAVLTVASILIGFSIRERRRAAATAARVLEEAEACLTEARALRNFVEFETNRILAALNALIVNLAEATQYLSVAMKDARSSLAAMEKVERALSMLRSFIRSEWPALDALGLSKKVSALAAEHDRPALEYQGAS
jgi:hypothetical protein